MNSEKYIELLEDVLLECCDDIGGENFIFQQDGASIHASKTTTEWLKSKNIETLPHPAVSPDLNPIENLWGIMARCVYQNERQFQTVLELKNCIRDVWNNFEITELRKLISSMPDRIFNVIQSNRGKTKY